MELKEFIERLKRLKYVFTSNIDDRDAIDTVLEELNNRIPIKKVEAIKQELEEKNLEIDSEWDSEDVKIAKYEDKAKLDLCKELLNKEYIYMSEEEKEKIKELIRLLYRDDLSKFGKRNLETYINKLMAEAEKVKQLEKENEELKNYEYVKALLQQADDLKDMIKELDKENAELKEKIKEYEIGKEQE